MKHTLHLIFNSSHIHDQLKNCLIYCGKNDSILLLQDGVYAALPGSPLANIEIPCLALKADLETRGLLTLKLHPHIQIIDDDEWVRQVTLHERTETWS